MLLRRALICIKGTKILLCSELEAITPKRTVSILRRNIGVGDEDTRNYVTNNLSENVLNCHSNQNEWLSAELLLNSVSL